MPAEPGTLLPSALRRRAADRTRRHGRGVPRDRRVLGRMVAVKVLAERYARTGIRERFAARRGGGPALRTPNIVTIFDVGEHHGRPFIVMEYPRRVAGGADAGRRPRPPAGARVARRGRQRRSTPRTRPASSTGVKPANLLLDGGGDVASRTSGSPGRPGSTRSRRRERSSARRATSRPSRRVASGRPPRATCTRWASSLGTPDREQAVRVLSPTTKAAGHVNGTGTVGVQVVSGCRPTSTPCSRGRSRRRRVRYATAAELVGELRRAWTSTGATPGSSRARPLPTRGGRAGAPCWPCRWSCSSLLAAAAIVTAVRAARGRRGRDGAGADGRAHGHRAGCDGPRSDDRAHDARRSPGGQPAAQPSTTPATRRCGRATTGGALPLLQRAVLALRGTGSTNEAYADYNLGNRTLCTRPLLERARPARPAESTRAAPAGDERMPMKRRKVAVERVARAEPGGVLRS